MLTLVRTNMYFIICSCLPVGMSPHSSNFAEMLTILSLSLPLSDLTSESEISTVSYLDQNFFDIDASANTFVMIFVIIYPIWYTSPLTSSCLLHSNALSIELTHSEFLMLDEAFFQTPNPSPEQMCVKFIIHKKASSCVWYRMLRKVWKIRFTSCKKSNIVWR